MIYRRPSGNPDKDVIDHVMQVKLAYKEQLKYILQQVRKRNQQVSFLYSLFQAWHIHSYRLCSQARDVTSNNLLSLGFSNPENSAKSLILKTSVIWK